MLCFRSFAYSYRRASAGYTLDACQAGISIISKQATAVTPEMAIMETQGIRVSKPSMSPFHKPT